MCLTLANAAFVLDHVTSVRPARSCTRALHHAGHLSPGDLRRALDGEYPCTAVLVRRHHDVITLTAPYADMFGPAAAVIRTAVPDAPPSGSGERLTSPAGTRTRRRVLRVRGKRSAAGDHASRDARRTSASAGTTQRNRSRPLDFHAAKHQRQGGMMSDRKAFPHPAILNDAGAANGALTARRGGRTHSMNADPSPVTDSRKGCVAHRPGMVHDLPWCGSPTVRRRHPRAAMSSARSGRPCRVVRLDESPMRRVFPKMQSRESIPPHRPASLAHLHLVDARELLRCCGGAEDLDRHRDGGRCFGRRFGRACLPVPGGGG